jgi:amino acid adenylation domain-containing protein
MNEHHEPSQFVAPPNLIEADCESIRPAMLTLVELNQQQIDSIVQTVPGGANNVQDIYPLTPLQEGMLFHHLLSEKSDTYVVSTLLELRSREQLEALIRALQNVIDRHDILRSAVLWEHLPRPVQVVYRRAHLPVEELALARDRDAIEQLRERITPKGQKWNLRQAPLMRLQVAADAAGTNWYALLQLHHVACDHGSLRMLVSEAMSHFEGRSRSLPQPVAYRTHVAQELAKARTHDGEAFFRGKLGTIDEPTAPFGLFDVHGDGTLLDEARRLMDPVLARRVRTQAHHLGVTAARLFHAAWALVVSRTSRRDEVVFGTALSATRQRGSQAQPIFGNFVNTLPLRVQLHGITARELVDQVQTELAELQQYESTSLVVAQRCSGIVGSAPLFSALLTYRHSVPKAETEWSLGAGIRVLVANQFRTNYPVTLTVDNLGDGFALTAQTDRRINPDRITEYFQTAMQSLLEALEKAPQTPALTLSILPDSERRQIIDSFNATQALYPQNKLIHELFQDQVQRTPESVAVAYGGQSLTYAELNERANQLARYLRDKGIGPEQLVGICVERSLDMVLGLLGILKAGGAYVALDPTYPSERLAYIVKDAAPKVLLIQERLRKRLPETAAQMIALDSESNAIAQQPSANLDPRTMGLQSHHLAYVIYTSGSSGQPKGVAIEHRNTVNLICWARYAMDQNVFSQTLHSTSLNFDLSVYECFVPLTTGGTIRVVENALALVKELAGVTLINTVPTAIAAILDSGKIPESTRAVNLAGEVLREELVERIFAGSHVERICNLYGPSETTTYSTWVSMTRDSGFVASIGRPIANTQIYILDQSRQVVPIAVLGEIYIGGAGVARGYLNRPDLTAERFLANPFSADPTARLYKTGDLGRWRSDGTIEFFGRNDHQVKIRGYRIELGEIEAQLIRHEQVEEAIVVAREDISRDKRLVAYVVADRNFAMKTASEGASGNLRNDIVSGWETLWKETYRTNPKTGPSFVGWNSSYTGQPIPEAQMQEWLSCAIERIEALKPRKVLEIGCGVGLLLQHLAPQCAVYVGADFSASAIKQLREWTSGREDLSHVELLQRSATELQDLHAGSFDTVVLNSVVQYFPDIEYLLAVLKEAVRLLVPGGKIFLGDIRNLGLLPMLNSAVQLSKAAATVSVGQLRRRIGRAVAQEKELAIDPRFFQILPGRVPGISATEVQLKRGQSANELTRYRYDVVLHTGDQIGTRAVCATLQWPTAVGDISQFEVALRARRWGAVRLCSIPNGRLNRDAAALRVIETSDERLAASALRLQLNELQFDDVDPEKLWELGKAYEYDVLVSPGEQGCIEVEMLDRTRDGQVPRAAQLAPSGMKPWSAYANDPLENALRQQLVPQLREYLQRSMPAHMVPSTWVVLKQLPLTPNGKVDRRALPAPQGRPEEMGEYIAPRSKLERVLADIWVQLLTVDQVGVQDNFFELGGHSLLIVQMIERLRSLGLSTNVSRVYETPTLESLARALTGDTSEAFTVPPNLIPPDCQTITPQMLPLVKLAPEHIERIVRAAPRGTANIQDIYPLASLQEGIFFHHLLNEKGGDTFILSVLLSVSSRDRLEELIAAFQDVIDRHDVLRTAVQWEQLPQPVQVVYREATLPVEELVLDEDRDPLEQLKERMRPGRQRMDLRKAPLMRLQVAANPDGVQWYVLLQLHHLVCDHESLDIMLAKLAAYLKQRAQGLPEKMPYRNHVAQVLAYRQTHDAEAFFRNKLGAIDEPTAPFGLLDVYGDGSRIDRAIQVLDADLAQRIRAQAPRLGVSAATLFHAAWALVVSHTSGRDDVVYGTVLLGRLQGNAGAQGALGLFINTLPLRLRLQDITAKELVEQTQRELGELLTHEQASLALAQRCSGIAASAPLFSSLLNYRHSQTDITSEFTSEAGVACLAVRSGTNYPIVLSVDDQGESFVLDMETDERVSPHRMIRYVSTMLQSLLDALERTPLAPALSLPILPECERHQVIDLFNATQADFPRDKLLHQLFEAQVERTPEAVAVVYEGRSLTYAELNGRANQLARHLSDKGIGPDQLVGICVERSLAMVVGLLGILKAGGAYVPLDPRYPTGRLASMLEDSAPRVLLIEGQVRDRLPNTAVQVVALDNDWPEIAERLTSNLDCRALGLQSKHLAYVIYTSGSTGLPKGVMIEHRSVVSLWQCLEHIYREFPSCQRIAVNASFTFDASVKQFVQLLSGRTIVLVPEEARWDASMLLDFIHEHRIDGIDCTPSQLKAWISEGLLNSNQCPLHLTLVGGEPIDGELWNTLTQRSEGVFYNVYGPTESTVDATFARLSGAAEPHIGRPMENRQVYILDRYGQPVPIGVAGEIYIGGTGVARGYLNQPDLTAQRFLSDPFSADPQARMYKTGDLGRWRVDGTVEFLGRNDYQLKIRGFRIELGEIEAQLLEHSQVKEAVVLAREDEPGEKRLAAYVVPIDLSGAGTTLSAEDLRAHLQTVLADYMVPSSFVILERLPLTSNGKVDRRALPRPELGAHVSDKYEPPQGEVENTLAVIWKELLHLERVGRQDNFFALGGHSLLATRVISRVRAGLQVELSVRALLDAPTVKQLSVRVEAERGAQAMQEALWMSNLAQDLRRDIDVMHDDLVLARIAELERELSAPTGGQSARG